MTLSKMVAHNKRTLVADKLGYYMARRNTALRVRRLTDICSALKERAADDSMWWTIHGCECAVFAVHITTVKFG